MNGAKEDIQDGEMEDDVDFQEDGSVLLEKESNDVNLSIEPSIKSK